LKTYSIPTPEASEKKVRPIIGDIPRNGNSAKSMIVPKILLMIHIIRSSGYGGVKAT
jgi:hypothetical protein